MRTKLGLAIASMTAASVLAFSAPSAATSTAPSTTDPEPTTTTTTVPPVIDGPVTIESDETGTGDPSAPERGTQVVINHPSSRSSRYAGLNTSALTAPTMPKNKIASATRTLVILLDRLNTDRVTFK